MAEASESAGGGEVLSQSEVDSLLAQVASQENAGAVVALQSGAPVETGDRRYLRFKKSNVSKK